MTAKSWLRARGCHDPQILADNYDGNDDGQRQKKNAFHSTASCRVTQLFRLYHLTFGVPKKNKKINKIQVHSIENKHVMLTTTLAAANGLKCVAFFVVSRMQAKSNYCVGVATQSLPKPASIMILSMPFTPAIKQSKETLKSLELFHYQPSIIDPQPFINPDSQPKESPVVCRNS